MRNEACQLDLAYRQPKHHSTEKSMKTTLQEMTILQDIDEKIECMWAEIKKFHTQAGSNIIPALVSSATVGVAVGEKDGIFDASPPSDVGNFVSSGRAQGGVFVEPVVGLLETAELDDGTLVAVSGATTDGVTVAACADPIDGWVVLTPLAADGEVVVRASKGVGDPVANPLFEPADGWLVVGAVGLVPLVKGGAVSPGQKMVSGGIALSFGKQW